MIDLKNLTIEKAHKSLKNGDFTAVELVEAYLEVIKTNNKNLNIFLEVFADAIEQARVADEEFKSGTPHLMTGIPIAIKDNILFKGHRVSAGSKILENYTATYDSTVVKKLKGVNAVIIGRTNMDEFAMGVSTENSAYGVTKNPHDPTRVPGGSSGGSTASVAIGVSLVALGSDTGGSCRQPASFCGVVGLKPTYGSVSRNGLIAMGSSLDVIGPIGKSVSDVEIVFNLIRGMDEMDSTSSSPPNSQGKRGNKKIIGVPRNLMKEGIDSRVLANFEKAIEKIKTTGWEVRDIELPHVGYSVPSYYIVTPAEISANLARFDGIRYGVHKDGENLVDDYFETKGYGFGREVKRRILVGTYVLSSGYYDAYYNKATRVRSLIAEDFRLAFEKVDLILTPTTTGPAFKIGEKVNDPVKMYLEDVFTAPANMTGLPAISIPAGFVAEGGVNLPVGIQFIAPHFAEDSLFQVGKQFEKIRN